MVKASKAVLFVKNTSVLSSFSSWYRMRRRCSGCLWRRKSHLGRSSDRTSRHAMTSIVWRRVNTAGIHPAFVTRDEECARLVYYEKPGEVQVTAIRDP